MRRVAQRAGAEDPMAAHKRSEHKAAKHDLRRAIKISKSRCWERLREDLNSDPWGLGYKIILRKLRAFAPAAPLDTEVIDNIVDTLFPTHPLRSIRQFGNNFDIPLFTIEELEIASQSMKSGKASGPDGIPPEVIKAVVKSHGALLLNMYNACLTAGIFPSGGKQQSWC